MIPRGLPNESVYCFLNVCVQTLIHLPFISEFFLSGQYIQIIENTDPAIIQSSIHWIVYNIIKSMNNGTDINEPLLELYKWLYIHGLVFVDGREHDAQEFLVFILDNIHESLLSLENKETIQYTNENADEQWSILTSNYQSAISKYCRGQIENSIICDECKNVSSTYEPFMYIMLDMDDVNQSKDDRMLTFNIDFYPNKAFKKPCTLKISILENQKVEELYCKFYSMLNVSKDDVFILSSFKDYQLRKKFSNDSILTKDDIQDCLCLHYLENHLHSIHMYFYFLDVDEIDNNPILISIPLSIETIENLQQCIYTRLCMETYNPETFPYTIHYVNTDNTISEPMDSVEDLDQYPFLILQMKENIEISLYFKYMDMTYNHFSNEEFLSFKEKIIITKDSALKTKHVEKITLCNLLDKFTSSEFLMGPEQYFCDRCNKKTNAVKTQKIHRTPNILIIVFKRFRKNMYGLQISKNTDIIQYPIESLNIEKYTSKKDENLIYHLTTSIIHYGTLFYGHYVADCFVNSVQKWYRFDDMNVMEIVPEQNRDSYVLFYSI